MEKKKNKSTIIIILLVIIILVLIGYIGYNKILNKESTEEISNEEYNDNNIPNVEENTETNSYKSLTINSSQCINDCSETIYTLGFSIAGDGIEAWIDSNNNTKLNINLNKDILQPSYTFAITESFYTFEFNQKIQDAFIGNVGQDESCPMLFILLDDGSVQYIDLYKKITTGNADIIELSEVKDVIKFYSSGTRAKDSMYAGPMTVLAQKEDGSFYDLGKIIFKQLPEME